MAEWAGDILMLVIVGMVLWGLAGDAVKKLGLGAVLEGVRPVVRTLRDGAVWCAYKLLVGRDPGVKHLTHDPHRHASVMSNRGSDAQTDRQTAEKQAPRKSITTAPLDISRYAVVKILVANAWTVSEVRTVVKGDNGEIGQEFERAKAELEDEGYRVPVRERPKVKGPPKTPERALV